jgi:hypothetical protein
MRWWQVHCVQPELEGVFVPLRNDYLVPSLVLTSPEIELAAYFKGPKRRGMGAPDGLDEADATFISGVLARWRLDRCITIDAARLADSHEAWVHVLVEADKDGELSLFHLAPCPRRAVLTWSNSD